MLLVSWPAQIAASDEVRHQYVHAVDIVPTVYDLLGIEPPEVIKGYPQIPIEGESFASALRDPSVPGKRTQFYTMLGQRALYHDGWLLTTVHPPLSSWGNFEKDEWELFHLETDRSQSNERGGRPPRPRRAAQGAVVLLRRPLQRPPPRRPFGARAGALRAAPRCARTGPVRLLPGLRRRARVGRTADPRPLVHHRRRRDRRVLRRGGRHLGRRVACPVGTPSTSRTASCATRSTGSAPTSRTSSPPSRSPRAPTSAWPSSSPAGPSQDPAMPGAAGTLTLYVDDVAVGSAPIITQPGLLLPDGRRHLRRP